MTRNRNKQLKNNQGFTLVELMVVVVILGILTGLAIPRFVGYIERARETKFVVDVRNMIMATEMAFQDDPNLSTLAVSSSSRKQTAEAIAKAMGKKMVELPAALYSISGVSAPSAKSGTYIYIADNNVYLRADNTLRTTGKRLAQMMGYDILGTKEDNKYIFWGTVNHSTEAHLYILLYER